jgi:hypothetical protein
MKTKILLWSVVAIFIIGLVAAVWRLRRPQVIIFSDGSTVTLLGADYGKVHMPPNSKARAASTNQLHLQRSGTSFITPDDELVVWVRQQYNSRQYHNFQYYLYDKAGTACVRNSDMNYDIRTRQNNRIVGLEFSAFPRRQGKFLLAVQEGSNGGQEMADQKFVIRNPARSSFTKWTAEPLPATQEDDDLSVTLAKLVVGADMSYQRNQDNPDDPVNKGVQAVFQVQRNGKAVNNWQPVSVVTTDTTGNHVNGWINGNQWQNDEDTATYQFGLWPDEPAWKIKFEFSQQSDFSDSELWTVQRIPIQPGTQQDFNNGIRNGQINAGVVETDLNGIHLKIFPAKQFTDVGPNSQPQGGLMIQTDPALPDGMRMTMVKLTDDQTNDVGYWDNGSGRYINNSINIAYYRYALRDLTGATNLNLTIALHKSRFVEFTAKPDKEKSSIP